MFKTQEYLQNKNKNISLFQHQNIKRMMAIMFFYSL